jgi:uncharacterized protein YlxW (UPF0749 family)
MGLLNYITAHSLDEDYAHVHELREQRGLEKPSRPGRSAVVVFALFGVLVATAAVQTARTAGADESSHENLVAQVNAGRQVLERSRTTLSSLRREVARAQRQNDAAQGRELTAEQLVNRLGARLGTVSVTGPGVKLVVDDAPDPTSDQQIVLDSDLRDIANGLWQAGAEAISINGYRLTTTSAIRVAGSLITVNYENVVPPYTVLAIGDPNRLPARFVESTTGTIWLNNKETFGLRFEMNAEDALTLPSADPKRFQLDKARDKAVEGAS